DRLAPGDLIAHSIDDTPGQRAVETIGRRRQVRPRAKLSRDERQGDVIPRKARSTEAETARQVLSADSRIEADRVRYDVHIAARQLRAHFGQHVGKCDLRRYVRV